MDPKDPNFGLDANLDANDWRLLTPETIAQLDKFRRVLQIIVASLVLGVLCFGGFVIAKSEGPRAMLGPERMDVMLALAGLFFILSFVVSPLIGGQFIRHAQQNDPKLQELFTGDVDHDRAIVESQRIQIVTIIGCSLLEGGAFANLFALMQSNDDIHTIAACILLIGIVWRFPTRSRYLRRIGKAVEAARLEQPLTRRD